MRSAINILAPHFAHSMEMFLVWKLEVDALCDKPVVALAPRLEKCRRASIAQTMFVYERVESIYQNEDGRKRLTPMNNANPPFPPYPSIPPSTVIGLCRKYSDVMIGRDSRDVLRRLESDHRPNPQQYIAPPSQCHKSTVGLKVVSSRAVQHLKLANVASRLLRKSLHSGYMALVCSKLRSVICFRAPLVFLPKLHNRTTMQRHPGREYSARALEQYQFAN